MNITRFAIHRPVTILMFVCALVLAGIISYTMLPVQELPGVNYPYLEVTVDDPGAAPQDVRDSVTDPIENALTTVNGIESMTAVSMEGVSNVTLQFHGGTDISVAANDVSQALHRIANRLPKEASLPDIVQTNPAAAPILNLTLSGKLTLTQLYTIAQSDVIPKIESVPGVAAVDLQGGLVPEINVDVNPAAMEAYGITLQQVRQALTTQNVSVAGGSLQDGSRAYAATTNTPYETVQSLRTLELRRKGTALKSTSHTKSVLPADVVLGQIATVTQSYASPTTITKMNGNNAVGISISVQSGANSLAVDAGVHKVLGAIHKELPPKVALQAIGDTTVYTRAALSAVLRDLLLAVLLTSVVLYVFLRRFSHTLIVLCAIPTSLISTFFVMYGLGFSLDLMSLLALSLLIGILVDDSIVVLENIHRHLVMGRAPADAALSGRMEIGAAAIAITLTDVVVYAPVAFIHGTVGQLFRELGLTVVAATLFSLFISFTLTPMLASKWLRPHRAPEAVAPDSGSRPAPPNGWFRSRWHSAKKRITLKRIAPKLLLHYEVLLRKTLKHRFSIVLVAVLSLVVSVLFLPLGWVKTEFVPQQNQNVFRVEVSMPTGTTLSRTDAAVQELVSDIRRVPSVSGVFSTTGQGLTGVQSNNRAVITVLRSAGTNATTPVLKPGAKAPTATMPKGKTVTRQTKQKAKAKKRGLFKRLFRHQSSSTSLLNQSPMHALSPLDAVIQQVNRTASQIPGMQIRVDVPNPLVISGSQPISINITGPQLQVLDSLAAQVTKNVTTLPGVVDVQNDASTNLPEWVVQVNPTAASEYGVTATTVAQAVQIAIQGAHASSIEPAGTNQQTNILVRLQNGSQMNVGQMQQIPIAEWNGQPVTLGQVATVTRAPGPVSLSESDRQLSVQVTAGVNQVPLGMAAKEVRNALQSISLPPGYTISLGGEIAQQALAFGPLLRAFILSVVLVYMLLAALYESLLTPLVVLFSLPMASVGAFLGLMLTGQTLNVYSAIAMIMLMGLVAKNGILLVDFTNQQMRAGMSRSDALLEAGKKRLRPIVMTTATMVFSMLPLALSHGVGSSSRIPVAAVLIGGMTTSTVLTLLVVPAIFSYINDVQNWMRLRVGLHRSMRSRPREGVEE